jgi:hypothetical protein
MIDPPPKNAIGTVCISINSATVVYRELHTYDKEYVVPAHPLLPSLDKSRSDFYLTLDDEFNYEGD